MPDSPATITRARVFIVDDHPLVRESLAALIDRQPDLCIGGQATDSATAFAAMLREPVEVALVDLSLPGESGLELIKRLQALTPPPRIVVLSMHDEALYAERALRAGAMGYVMKQESTDRVLVAIREVLKGRPYVSNDLAARFALRLIGNNHSAPGSDSPATELSDRELDVFRLIGEGRATKRIAHDLRISVKTVQTHCANIKEKLHLANSHELICEAVRWVESTKFKN